jgi:hypothetical protein
MKTIAQLILLVFVYQVSFAQKDSSKNTRYRCTIKLLEQNNNVRGEIYETGDSVLLIKSMVNNSNLKIDRSDNLIHMPVTEIDMIRLNRKGKSGEGFLIGGLSGMVIGAILVLASPDPKPDPQAQGWDFSPSLSPGNKALIGGIIGFLPGAIIGSIISSAKITIPIHGKKENYLLKRSEISSYSFRKK